MNSKRLLQLRMAQGLSLEGLSSRMGGMVTKQALSKYEKGIAVPKPSVLSRLADALGVKMAYFMSDSESKIEIIAYRKKAGLTAHEKNRVESIVSSSLEKRVEIQRFFGTNTTFNFPIRSINAGNMEDTERAAEQVRCLCNLGTDPIASVTNVLESCNVHVIELDADGKFDGISALAQDSNGVNISAAVVSRRDLSGERQRLNLAHELGHLVLNVGKGLDPEKAAYRFGASFLVPSSVLKEEVGSKRTAISLEELLLLKRKYGISIQALIYRMHQLEIISDSYFKDWCIHISKSKWRISEPEEIVAERSLWLKQHVMRAFTEGLIGSSDVENVLGEKMPEIPNSLVKRRAFMNLTISERNKILNEQADNLQDAYNSDSPEYNIGVGDVIEY